MRIAMITTWNDRCGIADYARRLVEPLKQRVEMEILPLDAGVRATGAPYYRRLAAQANEATVVHLQHEYSFFGGGTFPPEARLLSTLSGRRCHFFELVRNLRVPTVMTLHELTVPDAVPWRASFRKSLRARLVRHANSLVFGSADEVITHSNERREKLIGLGLPPDRIHTIPIGIPETGALPAKELAKQAWGLSGRFVIAMFGFVLPRKGYSTAVELMRDLPPQVTLLIAGGKEPNDVHDYASQLERQIARLSLGDRVKMTGYLSKEDVSKALAASDLALAPFDDMGGNSASIATALAHGLPVLGWTIPQMVELQGRLDCLVLFPHGDRAAMADRITRLIGAPAELAALGDRVRRSASSNGCVTEAERTIEVYEHARLRARSGAERPRWRWDGALHAVVTGHSSSRP
jgi:glycosyltransferase involved in cell wall biosynthesis